MKRTEMIRLVLIAIVAGLFSFVVSGALFSSPAKRTANVPVAQPLSTSFPDVTNDPNYSSFLNPNALDPTQPIQIGTGQQNTTPFNQSQ